MSDANYFDDSSLEQLEQKLWRLIESRSLSDEKPPPHLSSLIASDACEEYSEALDAYAWLLAHKKAPSWDNQPLLDHLAHCAACQQHLERLLVFYTQAPRVRRRAEQNIDITLLYKHLPLENDLDVRGILNADRPVLLGAGLLEQPPGWYYSLEQTRQTEDGPRGVLLSLINPHGDAANIAVRMVLLGRILHGVTDEKGQAFFQGIQIPMLKQPLAPAINLHLDMSS